MREYGEILSIRDEVWKDFFPGIPNGVKILRMKLSKAIPSYITVESEMTLVTYRGQAATCKHCNRNVHYNQKCSEYAKSLRTSVNNRLTMAGVLKHGYGREENTEQDLRMTEEDSQHDAISDMDESITDIIQLDENIISPNNIDTDPHSSLPCQITPGQGTSRLSPPETMLTNCETPEMSDFPLTLGLCEDVHKSGTTNNQKRSASPLQEGKQKNPEKRITRSGLQQTIRSKTRSNSGQRHN